MDINTIVHIGKEVSIDLQSADGYQTNGTERNTDLFLFGFRRLPFKDWANRITCQQRKKNIGVD